MYNIIIIEHQKRKVLKWAESFCSAWNKVKGINIKTLRELLCDASIFQWVIYTDGVTVPPEYLTMEMSVKQPLGYFIPMKRGEGVCSIALAICLAKLQNDFISLSWEKLKVTTMLELILLGGCLIIIFIVETNTLYR